MNVFMTASNAFYARPRRFNIRCATRFGGFDKVIEYDIDKDIDKNFYDKNKEILTIKRGAGLWLWKPYCIYKALTEECNDGDVLFYLDAAAFIYRDMSKILNAMDQDIYAVELPYVEEEFTKREVFDYLGIKDDRYKKTRQFQASYMAFRKNESTLKFVQEWLELCQNPTLLSPSVTAEQVEKYRDHRMDQSLFSLTCKKYSVIPSAERSQFAIWGYPYVEGCSYFPLNVNKKTQTLYLHRSQRIPNIRGWLVMIYKFYMYYRIRYSKSK